jgi:septal ring factor EnvC (AmiA/AmiB activator)
MKDEGKTKEQLLKELKTLNERLAKLERAEIERKRTEDVIKRNLNILGVAN